MRGGIKEQLQVKKKSKTKITKLEQKTHMPTAKTSS